MANMLDPWTMDPLAAMQPESCGSLIAQPLPERGGTLRLGTDCGCGCGEASTDLGLHGYAPPDEGNEGVNDSLLCQ